MRLFALGCVVAMGVASGAAQAAKVCDVRSYGAKGDRTTNDAVAIQKAIDACAARKGGGTVKLSGGTFLSGPIVLKSNITLDVEKGTTLLASPVHSDFPRRTEFRAPGFQPFVGAENAENIKITGGGVIDGNGMSWWVLARHEPNAGVLGSTNTRPRGVVFDHCKHVVMENITVQNSAFWQIVPYYTEDVVIRDVTVLADPSSPNTDAIDPFSSSNILIERVTADVGDDNIAIKSGMINSPGPDAPSKNIVIRDCTFKHGHGLSIGSEIAGGAQNITAERIRFSYTDNGVRIKANRDRGADVSNIVFKDITMDHVRTALLVSAYYPQVFPEGEVAAAPIGRLTPIFHNITIENLTATDSNSAGVIVGLPEAPVKDITLRNVRISANTGMRIAYADVVGDRLIVNVPSRSEAAAGEAIQVAPSAKLTSSNPTR